MLIAYCALQNFVTDRVPYDRGQELGQAVKAENLEGQAVKGTSQITKSQGSSTVKVNRIQNLIKARYHTLNSVKSKAYLSDGQAVKALIKVKFFDRAVAGVGTESIGVTSPCFSMLYLQNLLSFP